MMFSDQIEVQTHGQTGESHHAGTTSITQFDHGYMPRHA